MHFQQDTRRNPVFPPSTPPKKGKRTRYHGKLSRTASIGRALAASTEFAHLEISLRLRVRCLDYNVINCNLRRKPIGSYLLV